MSQLSSIETAELQKQHGTSHVQMSGIRVLWVPLPTERVHPSWSHATALISKILYMIPFTAAKFSDHSSGGLLGHFSGLSAKWHPWMQWLCVPSFLQKIIRKTFPLLHVNVRIKHKLTFISKPLFFFFCCKSDLLFTYFRIVTVRHNSLVSVELLGGAGMRGATEVRRIYFSLETYDSVIERVFWKQRW